MSGVTPLGNVPGHGPIDRNLESPVSALAAWLASDPEAVPVGAQSHTHNSARDGLKQRGLRSATIFGLRADLSQKISKTPTNKRNLLTKLLGIKGNSLFKQSLKFMGTTSKQHCFPLKCLTGLGSTIIGVVGAIVFAVPSLGNKIINSCSSWETTSLKFSENLKERISNTTDPVHIDHLYEAMKGNLSSGLKKMYLKRHDEETGEAAQEHQKLCEQEGLDFHLGDVNISSDSKKEIMNEILEHIHHDLEGEKNQAQAQNRADNIKKLQGLYPNESLAEIIKRL